MFLIKKTNYKTNKRRINLGKIYELKTETKAG